jgi:hypothetical protein
MIICSTTLEVNVGWIVNVRELVDSGMGVDDLGAFVPVGTCITFRLLVPVTVGMFVGFKILVAIVNCFSVGVLPLIGPVGTTPVQLAKIILIK